jgi:hypothetical protein
MEQSTTGLNLALSMQNIKAWWSGTQPNVPCLYFSRINQSTKIFNALTYLLTYICSRSHSIFRFSPFTLVIFFFFFSYLLLSRTI